MSSTVKLPVRAGVPDILIVELAPWMGAVVKASNVAAGMQLCCIVTNAG
jgi:hypothetical protein